MSKSLLNAALCGALFAAGLSVQAAPREVTYLLPAPPNSPAFAPWVIAREKGYYADLGLKVTFVAGKGGVDVAKQIGAGNAPVGGAIGDTPIVVRANGIPVKAVAVLGAGGVTMIATDGTAGIDSVKDLKGKTLTVMSYSDTTYYALLASMRKAGLGKSDVDIQAARPIRRLATVLRRPLAGHGRRAGLGGECRGRRPAGEVAAGQRGVREHGPGDPRLGRGHREAA